MELPFQALSPRQPEPQLAGAVVPPRPSLRPCSGRSGCACDRVACAKQDANRHATVSSAAIIFLRLSQLPVVSEGVGVHAPGWVRHSLRSSGVVCISTKGSAPEDRCTPALPPFLPLSPVNIEEGQRYSTGAKNCGTPRHATPRRATPHHAASESRIYLPVPVWFGRTCTRDGHGCAADSM